MCGGEERDTLRFFIGVFFFYERLVVKERDIILLFFIGISLSYSDESEDERQKGNDERRKGEMCCCRHQRLQS